MFDSEWLSWKPAIPNTAAAYRGEGMGVLVIAVANWGSLGSGQRLSGFVQDKEGSRSLVNGKRTWHANEIPFLVPR